MGKLGRILKGVDTFTKWQGYLLAPLCTTLIIIVVIDITLRELGQPIGWAWDIEWFHWAFLMTFAMGYSVLKEQHVRIDLLTTRFSPRTQAALIAFSYGVVVIPFMVMVAIYAWDFVGRSIRVEEVLYTTWTWRVWPIKAALLGGIFLMMPQCIAALIRNVYFAVKGERL